MTVSKKVEGELLEVKVDGRLDTSTAPELENELKESLEGIKKVNFDFEKLEYISSAGLRVLLSVVKKVGGQSNVVIKNSNETVKEIFDVTGFVDILSVE